ncbi:MAG: AsmA family protein, partial [Thiohalospira sp.]
MTIRVVGPILRIPNRESKTAQQDRPMRKLLRYLLVGVAALVALLIAAAVILPLVIDPDDYRDEIEAAVNEATGRELAIEGSIGLSY